MTRPSGLGLGGGPDAAGGASIFACDGSMACNAGEPAAAMTICGELYDDTRSATRDNAIKRLVISVYKIWMKFAANA